MPFIHTEIEIAAPANRVWKLLTDFERYPNWNPAVARLQGLPRQGERLHLHARIMPGLVMPLRPTLRKAEANRELIWSAHLGLNWLMAGEHRFNIQELPTGRIKLIQHESFTGVLAPLLALLVARWLTRAYEEAGQNLKRTAELTTEAIRQVQASTASTASPRVAR